MKKTPLNSIAKIYNGNSINAKTKAEQYSKNIDGWSYIGTKDVNADGSINYNTGVTIPFGDTKFKLAPENCVLVCSEGGSAGKKTAHNTKEICFGNKLYAIANDKKLFNSKYIYYYTRYREFFEQFTSLMNGIIGGVSSKKFGTIEVPLPPLPEQEKIVLKIEELFSELDKGIEELEQAKARLKVYRQSVLKNAFDGCKKYIKIKDICSVVRGGSPRPAGSAKFYNGNIPFLKVADLTRNRGLFLTTYTYTIKEAGLKKTRLVSANTLLLSNSGATLGVPKICTFETTFNDGIAAFLNMENQYLPFHYYFWESKTLELRAINQGAAQPNLNTDIIGNMDVPYLSYEQQEVIAQHIESKLSICDNIEQTIIDSLKKTESLRQSILKKAFNGELV